MRPILFDIAGLSIQSFFFMIMLAALGATYVGIRAARSEGLSEVAILDMSITAVIASILGSRIFHIFVEAPRYYWEDPIRVFYFWQGGFVSLGAFMASITGWVIYLKVKKLDVIRYCDIGALVTPVIIFFVRVGCLLTGCCYGKPTDFFFHLTFHNPASTAYYYYPHIPLHSTQVYGMINAVILFLLLLFVYKRRRFYGQVISVFLIYYPVTRFLIEFLRGDADRGVYLNSLISTAQIVAIFGLIIGLSLYRIMKRKRPIS